MEAHLKWVGIVVKDLERAKALYTELFGYKFHEPNPFGSASPVKTNPFGGILPCIAEVDIDKAGASPNMELIMPIPGRDSEYAEFLHDRGEGLFGANFVTDDIDEVRRRAERMGITIFRSLDFDHKEIERHSAGNYKRTRIIILRASPETCGVRVFVTQRDSK